MNLTGNVDFAKLRVMAVGYCVRRFKVDNRVLINTQVGYN